MTVSSFPPFPGRSACHSLANTDNSGVTAVGRPNAHSVFAGGIVLLAEEVFSGLP